MKKYILLAVFLVAVVASSQAQTEKRSLRDERRRIAQGIRSGQITKAEALVLRKQAKDVRRTKAIAVADGVVTPQERGAISRQDRQLDRTIRRTKHNKRTRG